MVHPDYQEKVVLSLERLNPDHPFGPLVPLGRFDWERILSHCNFKPNTVKLVGYAMATFADLEKGTRIYPGDKRLSAIACISLPTVKRVRKILEDAGLIHLVSSGSSYGRAAKASEYRLVAPRILAEEYRDEMNVGGWFAAEMWEPSALWEMSELLKQVSPVSHVPTYQVSPVTRVPAAENKEQVSLVKEQVSNAQEQVSPVNGSGVTTDTPSTYRSTYLSMNHQINESAAALSPNATLEGQSENFDSIAASQNLTEEQERNRQSAALLKMIENDERTKTA